MTEQESLFSQTLYQKDTKGRVKIWEIKVGCDDSHLGVDANRNCPAYYTVTTGLQGGKMQSNATHIKIGKNISKANETTPLQQATADAKSKAEKKEKEGYVDDLANIRDSDTLGSGTKEPMLAEKYDPKGLQKGSKTLDKILGGIRGKRVGIQRKKDGNRANPKITFVLDTETGELTGYLSRKGTPYPYNFPRISEVLLRNYQNHPELHGKEVILDGELYTKELTFNELNGILKKKTLTEAHIVLLDTVEFHLYDICTEDFYERRIELFTPFGEPAPAEGEEDNRRVKVIETIFVEAQDDILLEWLLKFLEEGEEGLIIRTLDQPYITKRTWNLIKYVLSERDEYRIIGMELDKRGLLGKFIMEARPGSKDRDGNPVDTFKVGTRQSRAELADILKNKEDYIGEMAVIEYRLLSEYGIPRFGKFIGLRADYVEPKDQD